MTNDTAITRLLYAILSQKCLKDIDWNKVANNPLLKDEITNGHAARMRYSRFKKQIEGTTSVPRKPRKVNPNSPKKPRVSKASKEAASKKVKNEPNSSLNGEKIKLEPGGGGESGDSQVTGNASTSEMGMGDLYGASPAAGPSGDGEFNPRIKQEPGPRAPSETAYMMPTPNPSTYASVSPSPSPSQSHVHSAAHSFQASMSDMDLMTSFNHISGGENLYSPLMGGHEFDGMGSSMMNDPYDMWAGHHASHMSSSSRAGRGGHSAHGGTGDMGNGGFKSEEMEIGEGGVLVKTEPRWEETYRQM